MNVKISSSVIEGMVDAPPSKSYTHRAIAIASLAKNTTVFNPLVSDDTQKTMHACRAFGADVNVERVGDAIRIAGVHGKVATPDDVVDVGNSGTTLRIMTAISSLVDGAVVLNGDASIRKRPNDPLLLALNDLGAEAFSTRDNGMAPIVVRGKLRGGKTFIDGSVSSQFITGLLIACCLAENDTEIVVCGELKSRPYVDITLEMLELAGAHVAIDEGANLTFMVEGSQQFDVPVYQVPGDFSSASYLLAAGALFGDVTVKNMYPTAQGDSAIISILEEMGADIQWHKKQGVVTVKQSKLHGCTIDVGLTPDLVPTLAVLGVLADGVTVIENAEHVRYKETDRLHAMATELGKMGANVREETDKLILKGSKLHGTDLCGWDDHRIVMALTLAGMAAGGTVIDTAESVGISYPDFFEHMKRLGANIETVH